MKNKRILLVPYTWNPVTKKQISTLRGINFDFGNSKKHYAPNALQTTAKSLISGLFGLVVFILFYGVYCSAQDNTVEPQQSGDLVLAIDGMQNDRGDIRIILADSAEGLFSPGKDVVSVEAEIRAQEATWTFTELPYGEYAIRLYHDENGNKRLDTLPILGVPSERYGFSNNARDLFGPPSYEEAAFDFHGKQMTVSITVK